MTKKLVLALLLVAFALPLHADFETVAQVIAAKRGVRRISIPLLGIARFAVWMVHPQGVHDFQLVTFEGVDTLESGDLDAIHRSTVRSGYAPIVQVRSKRGEWSYIYARPDKSGKRMDLLILAHDNHDTALVRVDVDMDTFMREMDHPRAVATVARR
ncbi:MAG TPA: hypothetical protein VFN10_00625 [Thermoanaerobaculia bacterium]|nr:hypothetical protein [Thermoanaerobaculia bacterium]